MSAVASSGSGCSRRLSASGFGSMRPTPSRSWSGPCCSSWASIGPRVVRRGSIRAGSFSPLPPGLSSFATSQRRSSSYVAPASVSFVARAVVPVPPPHAPPSLALCPHLRWGGHLARAGSHRPLAGGAVGRWWSAPASLASCCSARAPAPFPSRSSVAPPAARAPSRRPGLCPLVGAGVGRSLCGFASSSSSLLSYLVCRGIGDL